MAQVIECLSSKHKAEFNPKYCKKKKEKEKKVRIDAMASVKPSHTLQEYSFSDIVPIRLVCS
jgi:hypothetical protein